jgi:Putative transposase
VLASKPVWLSSERSAPSALNLNVHIHALVLDGVFAKDGTGALRFHPTPNLTTLDVAEVLATVEPLMARRLQGRGRGEREADASDGWVDEAPVLAGLAAASVQGTIALGPSRGARLRRLGDAVEPVETSTPGPCHARANGFDLHAGLVVPAGQRERLERIVRYALRPPVAQERLHLTDDGKVRLELRHPWRDGTTDLVFDPVEFLGLAVLVPRPRINLLLYYGVLGPRAAWRAEVVPRQTTSRGSEAALKESATGPSREPDPAETARRQARGQCWASLIWPARSG